MTTIDPADSVKALLEEATRPLSTGEITETLKNVHGRREVEEALDFWRREPRAAIRDGDGNWSWVGPRTE